MPGYLVGQLLGFPAYKDKTTTLVVSAQDTLYKAILVLLTVTAIIWMSVFLYATFYYSYMPAISHARPVHLQFRYWTDFYVWNFARGAAYFRKIFSLFDETRGHDTIIIALYIFYSVFRSCDRGKHEGMCTFPTASVILTKRQQLLMVGQPYRVILELEMPESEANQQLGMFMVCVDLKDRDGEEIARSCRSAMLHYKSYIHHILSTLVYSPFLLSGSTEEKQVVHVELFSSFEEDPNRPITEATVQLQSNYIEVYQTSLKIHAHFTGLRYFMFHWPIVSAAMGITTNLFFLSVIAFLSWFKFFSPKQVSYSVGYDSSAAKSLEERRALAKQRLLKERGKLLNQRIVIPNESQVTVATKKDDLDTATTTPSIPASKSEPIMAKSVEGKVLGEQNDSISNDGSDSDTLMVAQKVKKVRARRASDEFVVLGDGKESPDLKVIGKDGAELESDTSSQGPEFQIEDEGELKKEGPQSEESLEDDKENKPNTDNENVNPEEHTTVRRRGSLPRRTTNN